MVLLTSTFAVPAFAQVQTPAPDRQGVEAQLKELRAMRDSLAKQMNTFDGRIDALESQLQASLPAASGPAGSGTATATAPVAAGTALAAGSAAAVTQAPATGDASKVTNAAADLNQSGAYLLKPKTWGAQEPGKGFVLARTDKGEMDVTIVTYVRYLNQTALEPTYTDFFGQTRTLRLQDNIQLNKVNLTFGGWLYDERFRYKLFLWTNNANAGEATQMVLAGSFTYRFANAFILGGGIESLPSTRSTTGNYPNWLRNDNRPMADEFFRGSYTTGIWADGTFGKGFQYRVMLANNLSGIGISASQLDPGLNTASAYLRWMPTTGEFGPAAGFGDYENHQKVATLFEAHYTYSRENALEQPGTNSVENSQIRLSDGTRLFESRVFGTPYRITDATYRMAAADAAVKYRGFALEGEYYARWMDDFSTTGPLPYSKLFDTGINVQASSMIVQKRLQAYATFSQIWGEFGNPTEVGLGLNWYPFGIKNFRITPNALWLDKSPVGYNGVPYVVGGKGWVFYIDAALAAF
ncbi:MAG: hypothetical protein ACRCUI_11275 [Polymorphobacter sp.]